MTDAEIIKAEDFLGNEINIGDEVIFEAPKYRDFVVGKVITKAEKTCQIEYVNDWNYPTKGRTEVVRQYYCQIIKYPDILINRQKAEVERLRTANDKLGSVLIGFMDEVSKWESKHGLDVSELPLIAIRGEAKEAVDKIKVEAINEFAERLEDEAYGNDLYDRSGYPINAIPINILLQVKKEMVGDTE